MAKPLDTWPLERATIVEWEPHPADARTVVELVAGELELAATVLGVLVDGRRLVPWVNVIECVLSAPA